MNDEIRNTWRSQAADMASPSNVSELLDFVRRRERELAGRVAARDFREILAALILVPTWIWMGVVLALPWTWYLTVPGLLWVAGYLALDRWLRKRRQPNHGENLRAHLEGSLGRVRHQIWLLRNVVWWYLVPLGTPMAVFLAHLAWKSRDGGSGVLLLFGGTLLGMAAVGGWIYWLNQRTVRLELEGRRNETEVLLKALDDAMEA